MALVSPQIHLSKWLVLMVSITSMISFGQARTRIFVSNKVTSFDKPKGAVKTIESHETGEVIDCVDIFKQPAFNHPLLKNHTIEMEPSSNSEANGAGFAEDAFSQPWWKYGECPEGTIPILRPQNYTGRFVKPLTPEVKRLNRSKNDLPLEGRHEYALLAMRGGTYKGASAQINVWNPTVMETEASFSQIWVASGPTEWLNSAEAGLMVSTITEPKYRAKLFIYWTSDGYGETGCYNLECEGFIQVNRRITLGAIVRPVSTYNGRQYHLYVNITRNDITGSWWLRVQNTDVGYWPSNIYTFLKCPAKRVEWGGEILNRGLNNRHTSTQMGSGHFPSEGYGNSSFFRFLRFVDNQHVERDIPYSIPTVTNPECYEVRKYVDSAEVGGVNFYYGGPGYSDRCPT